MGGATAETANSEIAQLRTALEREQRAREQAERDSSATSEQLREMRIEVARLRDELQTVRAEGESAKINLARLEGEKQAETNRVNAEQRDQQRRAAESTLKQTLAKYGKLKETSTGFQLHSLNPFGLVRAKRTWLRRQPLNSSHSPLFWPAIPIIRS